MFPHFSPELPVRIRHCPGLRSSAVLSIQMQHHSLKLLLSLWALGVLAPQGYGLSLYVHWHGSKLKKSPARHCYLRHLKPNPLFPKSVIGLVWILNYLKNIKWAKFLYTCAINPKNYSIWQLMDFLSAITKQHSHPYVFNLSKIHFLELLNVSEKKKTSSKNPKPFVFIWLYR